MYTSQPHNAKGCKINGCKGSGGGDAKYEDFWYGVIFDNNLKIKLVRVLEYSSDYGYEISSKNWLKQFIGYEGQKLRYGKDIDAVSGATISAQDLTNDIEATYKGLRSLYGKLSDGPN